MDASLAGKMQQWWGEDLPVDGWVEVENGHAFIELFPYAIHSLKLQSGDYVRISIVRNHEKDKRRSPDIA